VNEPTCPIITNTNITLGTIGADFDVRSTSNNGVATIVSTWLSVVTSDVRMRASSGIVAPINGASREVITGLIQVQRSVLAAKLIIALSHDAFLTKITVL